MIPASSAPTSLRSTPVNVPASLRATLIPRAAAELVKILAAPPAAKAQRKAQPQSRLARSQVRAQLETRPLAAPARAT